VKTVLLTGGAIIYLSTAVVVAYAVRAALLARVENTVPPAVALLAGWMCGLLWPPMLLAGAILLAARRLKGVNR